jgi:subtilase family serine protease
MKPVRLAAFIGAASLLAITLGAGTAGPALAGTDLSAQPGADSAAQLTPKLVGSGPVLPSGVQRIGPLAASTSISADVMLAPRSAAALQDYAANVSSPGNSLYHRYLTVGQFASMFGPTASAISTVEASLRADGLTPGPLSANHLVLPVTATAGQFGKAFSIGFDRYRLPGGPVAFANTTAPMFSGAAAGYVSGVVGLDTVSRPQALGQRPAERLPMKESPQVVTGGPQPCATAVTDAPLDDAYTADQIASAYDFSPLYGAGDEGSGVTVALLELEPNLPGDISAYQSCYGTDATVNYVEVDGGPGSGDGQVRPRSTSRTLSGWPPRQPSTSTRRRTTTPR